MVDYHHYASQIGWEFGRMKCHWLMLNRLLNIFGVIATKNLNSPLLMGLEKRLRRLCPLIKVELLPIVKSISSSISSSSWLTSSSFKSSLSGSSASFTLSSTTEHKGRIVESQLKQDSVSLIVSLSASKKSNSLKTRGKEESVADSFPIDVDSNSSSWCDTTSLDENAELLAATCKMPS